MKTNGSLWCWGTFVNGSLVPAPFVTEDNTPVTNVWRIGRSAPAGNARGIPLPIKTDGRLYYDDAMVAKKLSGFPCP